MQRIFLDIGNMFKILNELKVNTLPQEAHADGESKMSSSQQQLIW